MVDLPLIDWWFRRRIHGRCAADFNGDVAGGSLVVRAEIVEVCQSRTSRPAGMAAVPVSNGFAVNLLPALGGTKTRLTGLQRQYRMTFDER